MSNQIRSKKGVEEPRVIVYVLFTTILVLSGIYVAFSYMGVIDLRFDFADYNFRYNSAAARMIYTSQCYAFNESYSYAGGKYVQVSPGILDITKLNSQVIPESCIRGEQPIIVNITQYDPDDASAAKNYILYNSEHPSQAKLDDTSEWKSKELQFNVILRQVNSDGSYTDYNGLMKLRLKK